jgi:hypothetical protein
MLLTPREFSRDTLAKALEDVAFEGWSVEN